MKQKHVAWTLNILIAITAILLIVALWFAVYTPLYYSYASIAIAIIGPVLGIVVSSRISFLKEMTIGKNKIRKTHLKDINSSCLTQLERNVSGLLGFFRFISNSQLPKPDDINQNSRYFEKGLKHFTLYLGMGDWNKILYNDLNNHTVSKEIPKLIDKLEESISPKYKTYIENYEKLYRKIEVENQGIEKAKLDMILLIAMDFDTEEFEHDWKNTWPIYGQQIRNDEALRAFVYAKGEEYKKTENAVAFVKVCEDVENERNKIFDKIKTVSRTPNLWENCDIVKKQIDNM